jgi:hypothetical protein
MGFEIPANEMCRLSGRHQVYFIVLRRAVNMAEERCGGTAGMSGRDSTAAAIDAVLVKPSRTNRHQETEPETKQGNRAGANM